MIRAYRPFVVCVLVCLLGMSIVALQPGRVGAACKALAVMSYRESFYYTQEIQEGIESALAEKCELRFIYLNVLSEPDNAKAKAEEAFAAYQAYAPDGVIAAGTETQELFVIPYMKERVETPVVFCGVNVDPATYGYPAKNVTGVLQHPRIMESLFFLQQIAPDVKTIGALGFDVPPTRALAEQIQQEQSAYPVTQVLEPCFATTLEEALTMTEALREKADALFLGSLEGIPDAQGKPMPFTEAVPLVLEKFGKPTFSAWKGLVHNGVLCTVVEIGQEQGKLAAEMLLKAVEGAPIADLPITQSKQGKRMLNVATMKALGLMPKPHILKGVEFVGARE